VVGRTGFEPLTSAVRSERCAPMAGRPSGGKGGYQAWAPLLRAFLRRVIDRISSRRHPFHQLVICIGVLWMNGIHVSADRAKELLVVAALHAIGAAWRVTVRYAHRDEATACYRSPHAWPANRTLIRQVVARFGTVCAPS
jgi:hypothetical protein